ncbi:MAG: glycosyltransferase family 39 protein [Planctomycetota bacterium]
MTWMRSRPYALPALTTLGLAFARLTIGGYKVDTALYAGVGWQMVRTGQWWTPMAGDMPYFNKPPLVIWIHAIFMSIAGHELWAIRLPQLLAAVAVMLASVHIARRLAGRSAALIVGMLVALTWPMIKHLNRLVLDYWTVLFILLAVVCVVEAWRRNASGVRAATWMLAAGVAVGLSTLCKPFFALLAIPILALWLLTTQRPRLAAWLAISIPAALAVNLPWHLSMHAIHGDLFTSQYLGREIVSRGVGDGGFGRRPWWWYFYFIAREWWPWQLLLYLAIATLILRRPTSSRPTRPALSFTLVWIGAWMLLLALFADKRDRYMMHLWPALALPCALWITRWSAPRIRQGDSRAWTVLTCLALLAGAVGLAFGVIKDADRAEQQWIDTAQHITNLRAQNPHTEIYEALRHPPRAGQLYLMIDVWPKPIYYGSPSAFQEPPPGAIVLVQGKDLPSLGLPIDHPHNFGDAAVITYDPSMRDRFERGLD